MEKQHILDELRRTASENSGRPLGIGEFQQATRISRSDWLGIHWAKWSDAIIEAGLKPNPFGTAALDEEKMLDQLVSLARRLKRFPTKPELKLEKRSDPAFPSTVTIRRRLGVRAEQLRRLRLFCERRPDYEDVHQICVEEIEKLPPEDTSQTAAAASTIGHVYLLKHDNAYKIGRSTDATQRYKQIRVQMPHETIEVHVIETDDPAGIEAYWHNRFKDKRMQGEWFRLDAEDVRAFKKRRFM